MKQGMKIVISSTQLMATISRLQGNLPAELLGLFNILDLSNLNISILGYECGGLLESYWALWKVKIFAPFGVFSIFLMILLLSAVLQKIRMQNSFDPTLFISKHFSSAIHGCFQIIIIFYTLIVSILLEPFLCFAQVDEAFIMLRNSAVQCYTGIWRNSYLWLSLNFWLLNTPCQWSCFLQF